MCGAHLTDEYCRWWLGVWSLLDVDNGMAVVRRGGVISVVGCHDISAIIAVEVESTTFYERWKVRIA